MPAESSMPRPSEHGEVRAWSWHHSGLVVADIDESIDFYHRTLGYEVELLVREMDDQFQRTVGLSGVVCDLVQLLAPYGGTRLELLEVRGVPAGTPPWMPVHVGIGHGAYQVRDLDASLRALLRAGGVALGEVVDFAEGRAVYCRSSTGTVIELEEAWI
ncbi:MAG: VOC family protein [Nocardioides sp.]|uniref:VOC family protein n=1 Tax=Nocardioides sp. TaxID=35761 RepID=UPI0039E50594